MYIVPTPNLMKSKHFIFFDVISCNYNRSHEVENLIVAYCSQLLFIVGVFELTI